MANLDRILKHIVIDVESEQTVAAFATAGTACRWADDMEERTGRDYEVKRTRG